MPNQFYLSLGSNIAPERNLPLAVDKLQDFGRLVAVSSVWESTPVGYRGQPNFLNAAVHLESDLDAQSFQDFAIPRVEDELGRVRTANKYGPRSIDIDIMLFNDAVIKIGHRPVPSPEIVERAFVAIPLAEIAPDVIHPQQKESMAQIAARFDPRELGMQRRKDVLLMRNVPEG